MNYYNVIIINYKNESNFRNLNNKKLILIILNLCDPKIEGSNFLILYIYFFLILKTMLENIKFLRNMKLN